MKQVNVPCINCTRRAVGCHVFCAEYAVFKRNRTEVLKLIHKGRMETEAYCREMTREQRERQLCRC